MNHLKKWLLAFGLLMSMHITTFAGPTDGTMPAALLRDATARNCAPIRGFYGRDGITLPPFFFDEQPENREYASAYVCERKKRYFLVLLAAESGSICKLRELALGESMPGGLAAFSSLLPLSIFRIFNNAEPEFNVQDAAASTRFRPIMIDYDGVQRIFYCYQGRWLEARFD